MILTKQQFDGAIEVGRAFYNHGMLTSRIAFDATTRVYFTPKKISVEKNGLDSEVYSTLGEFEEAYGGV